MKPLLPLLLPIALSTCGLLSDPGAVPVRIAVNVGSLAGAIQEDFNSVMDRVDLVITDFEGAQQTLSIQLDPGEVDPAFDVDVKEGLATFAVTVVSTDGLPLHEGVTTSTIDQDGFEVTIVPQPVRGVLIVSPREPGFPFVRDSDGFPVYGSTLVVRNSGSADLAWRVQLSQSPNEFTVGCVFLTNDDVQPSCLEDTALPPNGQVSIEVTFTVPPNTPVPASGAVFLSTVGNLTVPTRQ